MPAVSASRGSYCLFETAVGPCAVAWTDRGLIRMLLPDVDRDATERRLWASETGLTAASPPENVSRVITDLRRYLGGSRVEFASAPLDLAGITPFRRSVYDAARRLGWGQTVSYAELAQRAGKAGAARAVGQALARNPVAIIIPCHRILASGNKVGGFTAFGGTSAKELLLGLEGVCLPRA